MEGPQEGARLERDPKPGGTRRETSARGFSRLGMVGHHVTQVKVTNY